MFVKNRDMLEGLVADVLTRVLGQYVDGLSRESIRVGVWGGQLALRNLTLKPEAVAVLFETLGLDLPVTVTAGFVGLLRVEVPWNRLRSAPVKVLIEGLTIAASPVSDGDQKALEERALRLKKARLAGDDVIRDAKWSVRQGGTGQRKSGGMVQWGWRFTSKFVTKIVDNLQFEVKDVVVRYEDESSVVDQPYTVSLSLDSLRAFSTNANWEKVFLEDSNSPMVHKLVLLEGLVVNWDPGSGAKALRAWILDGNLGRPDGESAAAVRADGRHVIAPMSGEMRVALTKAWALETPINASTECSRKRPRPRVQMDIYFPEIDLTIDDFQYHTLLTTIAYLSDIDRKVRPKSARGRWFWALDRLLPRFTERRDAALSFTEEGLCKRRRERLQYIESRKELLNARRKGLKESMDLMEVVENIETKLNLNDIFLFRDLLDQELAREVDSGQDDNTTKSSVWSLFTRAKSRESDAKSNIVGDGAQKVVLGEDIEDENILVDHSPINGQGADKDPEHPSIGADSDIDLSELWEGLESNNDALQPSTENNLGDESAPPNFRMGFLLQRGSIELKTGGFSSDPEKAANLVFRELLLGVETSPCHGFLLEMLLGTIELLDLQKRIRVIYPRLPWAEREALERRASCELSKLETGLSFYPNDISKALDEIRGGYEQPDVTFCKADESSVESSSTTERGSLTLSEESQYMMNTESLWERAEDPLQYVAALRINQESAPAESIWAAGASRVAMDLAIGGLEAIIDGPGGCFISTIQFWIPKFSEASIMSFLSRAAAPRLAHIRMELQRALLERSVPMRVNVLIQSPRFILPRPSRPKSSLVLDLGTFAMSTAETASEATYEPIIVSPSTGAPSERPIHYTDYSITFSDFGVFLTLGDGKAGTERLVKPFSLHLLLKVLHNASFVEATCKPEARAFLPRKRMCGQLGALKICISRRAFRHLLKIAESWNSVLEADEEPEMDANVSASAEEHGYEAESQREYSKSGDRPGEKAHLSLAVFSMELEFPDLKLEFRNHRNKRIVTFDTRGTSVHMTKRIDQLDLAFRLQSFAAIDGSRGSTAPFRELIRAGGKHKSNFDRVTEAVDGEKPSFVSVAYFADSKRREQELAIRILSMQVNCVRESYLAIAEFFYRVDEISSAEPGDEHSEQYSDPFKAIGMTTVAAARKLKAKAERGIELSKEAFANRGRLVLTADLDGLDALLVTEEGGIASFAVTGCTVRLEQESNGAVLASGRLGGFNIQDLTASCNAHSKAITYTCSDKDQGGDDDGWQVILPPEGQGDYWLRARLQNLRIVYLQRFLIILRTYFVVLQNMLKPILSMKGSILEVFEGEAGEDMLAIAPKRSRLRVQIVTDNVHFVMPRHSQSPHEGLQFVVGRSSITNEDQAAPGYRVGMQLLVEGVNGYVMFCQSIQEATGRYRPFLPKASDDPISPKPFVKDVRLVAKIDWWRRRKVPQIVINEDGAPVLKKGEEEVDYDPKTWLAAFRIRIVAPEGLNARLCEAEYTILYFTFTENIIERPDIEFTDLVRGLKTPVIPYRSPIEPIMLSSHPMPPFLSILFEVPVVHSITAYGGNPGDSQANLVMTELRNVYGKFQYGVDCRIMADISGNLGYLKDIRPQASRHQIVAYGVDENDTDGGPNGSLNSGSKQVTYTYDRPFGFRSSIMVVISKLRVLVVPELFRDLGLLTPIGSPYLESSAPAPIIRFNGRLLIVTLSNTEVNLMADEFAHDARGIVLRGDVIAKIEWAAVTGRKIVNIATKGVRLGLSSNCFGRSSQSSDGLVANPQVLEKETPFVYPCDASVSFHASGWNSPDGPTGSPKKMQGKSLSVSMEALLCRTNVNDVPLLVSVLSRLTQMRPSPVTARLQLASIYPQYEDEGDDVDARLSVVCSLLNGRLIFTDEAGGTYTPIMEIRTQHFILKSSFPWMTNGRLELSVDLFNEARGCWEPGVEPFSVDIIAAHGRSGSRAIQVRVEKTMDINVSSAIITGAVRVSVILQRAAEDLLARIRNSSAVSKHSNTESKDSFSTSRRPSVAAFCVKNHCGRSVTVWFPHDSSKRVIGGDGEEYEVDMPTDELASSARAANRDCKDANTLRSETLRCTISLSGYEPVSLSVAEVGTYMVRFSPRRLEYDVGEGSDLLCMIWDVTMREGVPVGCLRSSVRIVNKTSTVLEVKLRTPMLASVPGTALDQGLIVLKAGAAWPIPLDAVGEEMRIRPALFQAPDLNEDESNFSTKAQRVLYTYGWSDPLSKISALVKIGELLESRGIESNAPKTNSPSTTAPVIACPAVTHGKPFIMTLLPKVRTSMAIDNHYAEGTFIDVILRSSLVIENATPFPIKFRVAQASQISQGGSEASVSEVSIRRSSSLQVNNVGTDISKLAFGISTALYRSPMVPNGRTVDSFTLGPKHAAVNVKVDHQTLSSSHAITVYVEYWIRNRSDTDLYFANSTHYDNSPQTKLLLEACPPGMPANPFTCFSGSFLSFQLAVGSAEEPWLIVGSKLEDVNKPVKLNFRKRSLLLFARRGRGKFHRSIVATVFNALWIENLTGLDVEWCQSSVQLPQGVSLRSEPHAVHHRERVPVHWDFADTARAICFRRSHKSGKSEWMWARPLLLNNQVGEHAVKMYCPRKHEQYIARANVHKLLSGAYVIRLYREDRSSPPYRIVNDCKLRSIAFHQSNVSETHPWLLRPGKSTRYSWDEPNAPGRSRNLAVEVIDHSMAEDKDVRPLSGEENGPKSAAIGRNPRQQKILLSIDAVTGQNPKCIEGYSCPELYVTVAVKGPTKVVTFAERPSIVSSVHNAEIEAKQRSKLNANVPTTPLKNENLDLEICVKSIGVSFVDVTPCELAYLRISQLQLRLDRFENSELVLLQVSDLQLDNQLPRPTWPTVLCAAGFSGNSRFTDSNCPGESSRPNVDFPAIKNRKPLLEITLDLPFPRRENRISLCRGLFCSLQPLDVRMDEDFVVRTYGLIQSIVETLGTQGTNDHMEHLGKWDGFEEGFDKVLNRGRSSSEMNPAVMSRLYVEQFELCPLKVTVSYRSSRSSSFENDVLGPYLRTLLAVLGNIDSAEFRFHALQLSHLFDTWQHFLSLVSRFYLSQLSEQKLAFIASNPLIGNPSALFESIASGASDFFIEPYKARTSSDFILGLGRGSSSLITNTFSGVLGSLSGIPRAISSGLEHAVGDESYLRQRDKILYARTQVKRNNPAHGLFAGAVSFGHGIASGAAGLVREPMTGAAESGATGFLRGIGKGVLGGVVKPITGALDLISEPAEGIRALVNGRGLHPDSLRPRRSFYGGRLTQYDLRSSLGNFVLELAESGATENRTACTERIARRAETVRFWTVLSRVEVTTARRELSASDATILWAILTHNSKVADTGLSASKIRIGMVTTSRVLICTLTGTVIFEANLERVVGTRAPLDDSGWLMIGVTSYATDKDAILPPRWHRIRCESTVGRNELEKALKSAKGSAFGNDSAVYSYERLKSIEMRAFGSFSPSSSKHINERSEAVQSSSYGRTNSEVLKPACSWDAIPTVSGIEIGAEDIEKQLESALASGVRRSRASRSIRIIIVNRLSCAITLLSAKLESGNWGESPNDEIEALSVSTMEVYATSDSTRDVAGVVVFTLKGNLQAAEDNGPSILALRWHNSILAGNEFAVQAPENVFVRKDIGEDRQHEIIFTILDRSKVLDVDSKQVYASGEPSPGPLLFRKQGYEEESSGQEYEESNAIPKLMQRGFEEQMSQGAEHK